MARRSSRRSPVLRRVGTGPDAQVGDEVDGRRLAEVRHERRVVADRAAVGLVRRFGEAAHRADPRRLRVGNRVGGERRAQDRVRHLLEVAQRDALMAVARERDLALLGDAQPAREGAPGLGKDRAVGRAAAAPDRAAAAVEQVQADARLPARGGQRALRFVQLPVRGDEPAVLVAVRVPDHHLLQVAPGREVPAVDGQREEPAHEVAAAVQVVDGLEQRHHLQVAAQSTAVQPREPRLAGQQQRLQQVAGAGGHGDDVDVAGLAAQLALQPARAVEHRQRLRRFRRVLLVGTHQRPRAGQLADQHRDPAVLVQRGVVLDHSRGAQDLRHHAFVDLAVLAQVEAREVEPEHLGPALDVAELAVGEPGRALRAQAVRHQREVRPQRRPRCGRRRGGRPAAGPRWRVPTGDGRAPGRPLPGRTPSAPEPFARGAGAAPRAAACA